MSLPTAQKFAWSLAKTLMTCVVLIQTSDGYAVMTDADYDGDRLCCKTDAWDSLRESRGIDGRDAQTCRTSISHDELAGV